MNQQLAKLAREVLFYSPFRRLAFPTYVYEFTPPQLCFLCQCIEDTRDVKGDILEVGCHTGATTIFLNKYLDAQKISKDYHAIDTFSGFVAEDVDFEVANRSKTPGLYAGRFIANKKKWFDDTMRRHRMTRVRSIQADVNEFDLTRLGPVSFALLDVDLYRPIRNALHQLYGALTPGGVIVVDDCDPAHIRWDGAAQAYNEFMEETKLPARTLHQKLGVLRKPALIKSVAR